MFIGVVETVRDEERCSWY